MGMGKKSEGERRVQTCSYKINKFWDLKYNIVTIVNSTILHT